MNCKNCDEIITHGNSNRIYCDVKCKSKFHNKYNDKIKMQKKNWEMKNREQISINKKKHYQENKEKISLQKKIYRENNKEKVSLQKKKYRDNNPHINLKWRKNNKEKINEYKRKEYNENSQIRLFKLCRGRIRDFMKQKGYNKNSAAIKMIGCTPQELKQHIEKQFTEGMSWDKMGEIHIDHFVPLASAKTKEEVIKLCHYTNLQPMWAIDNLKKGARY